MSTKRKTRLAICVLFVLFNCVKKEKKEEVVAIIGTDTLTATDLKMISIDTVLNEERIKGVILQKALEERHMPIADTSKVKKILLGLKEQIYLKKGVDISKEAATSIFYAADELTKKIDCGDLKGSLKRHLDTTCSYVKMVKGGKDTTYIDSVLSKYINNDTILHDRKKCIISIYSDLLNIPIDIGGILFDFVEGGEPGVDSTSLKDMVQGLIFDSTKKERKLEKRETFQKDNSVLALKFRSLQSIKDSIEKHIPNIEAHYKKQLKASGKMAGVVYVTFRVSASGDVLSAEIKSTDIYKKEFIDPFLEYCKSINFKPIPKRIGNMRFDFPFEFKPES